MLGHVKKVLAGIVLVGVGATHLALGWGGEVRPDEAEVRAALIYNVLRFADWPPEQLAEGDEIRVGFWGSSEVAADFVDLARQPLRGHAVRVVHVGEEADLQGLHAVYFHGGDRAEIQAFLNAVAGSPVLTLTEIRGGLRMGSMVNFFRVDGRYRIEISLSDVKASGLTLKSSLLRLARVYERGKLVREIE
ncbi:MAG TPA: YfiR family protein [Kiritimatiellia bacterium]|nr:YfiR family protein [Kiritimatiellia bacterium]